MNIAAISKNVTTIASKAFAPVMKISARPVLLVKKYSPEILIGVGITGIIVSTVMFCKRAPEAEKIVNKAEKDLKEWNYYKENSKDEDYPQKEYAMDILHTYVDMGIGLVQLYGPPIFIGVTSIGCILGSHHIMVKRNAAIATAYNLLQETYKEYRARVEAELGSDKEKKLHYGIKETKVLEEETKEEQTTEIVNKDPNRISPYARFFDESSKNWSKTPEYNLIFLNHIQNYMNDLLKSRGHVFLNEVYDALGIPRSQAGAVVGWVISNEGDNYIDFGIYELNSSRKRDFVNGYEPSILLDFNVDGVIYDLI